MLVNFKCNHCKNIISVNINSSNCELNHCPHCKTEIKNSHVITDFYDKLDHLSRYFPDVSIVNCLAVKNENPNLNESKIFIDDLQHIFNTYSNSDDETRANIYSIIDLIHLICYEQDINRIRNLKSTIYKFFFNSNQID